jgi:hypothetical protein
MSFDLTIRQAPLAVTPSHSDHTWNVVLNDWSGFTDIKLVVDVYKNPYQNDSGSTQDYGKVARLIVPPNQFGNCIFNVETIIYNIVDKNPRGMAMVYNIANPANTTMNAYQVQVAQSSGASNTQLTNQANITNDTYGTIAFSNGFNGGYAGFENIYQVNEYRLILGVQYTNSGGTTDVIIDTNYSAYTGNTGSTITLSASSQPYGVMIWPGVQENKFLGVSTNPNFTNYYNNNNLNGQFNFQNLQVYDWAMNQGVAPFDVPGNFMATYGVETIPMTAFGGSVKQTRWRTHYYKCPILVGFMYGENPLYDNSSAIGSISYLTKSLNNGQMNYDVAQTSPVGASSGATHFSYLNQRIAYGLFKHNPNVRTDSDVAVFLSSASCDNTGADAVSEIVQYKMVGEECFNDPVYFLFMNRQGVWDTYTFTKKFTKKYGMNKKTYSSQKSLNTQFWNRQSYDEGETVFYGDAEELVTVDSGFVLQNDVQVIEDLLMSPYVYMIMDNWIPADNQSEITPYLIPCTVENKDVKQYINKYERIFQYTIELKQVPYRNFILPF